MERIDYSIFKSLHKRCAQLAELFALYFIRSEKYNKFCLYLKNNELTPSSIIINKNQRNNVAIEIINSLQLTEEKLKNFIVMYKIIGEPCDQSVYKLMMHFNWVANERGYLGQEPVQLLENFVEYNRSYVDKTCDEYFSIDDCNEGDPSEFLSYISSCSNNKVIIIIDILANINDEIMPSVKKIVKNAKSQLSKYSKENISGTMALFPYYYMGRRYKPERLYDYLVVYDLKKEGLHNKEIAKRIFKYIKNDDDATEDVIHRINDQYRKAVKIIETAEDGRFLYGITTK